MNLRVLPLLALPFLALGCGGSEPPPATPASTPAKPEVAATAAGTSVEVTFAAKSGSNVTGKAMLTETPGVGQRYIAAYQDADGAWLSGGSARLSASMVSLRRSTGMLRGERV